MRLHLLLLLFACSLLLPREVAAQESTTTTTTETYYNIDDAPDANAYQNNTKIDKRRWHNDIRASVGIPGVIQLAVMSIIVDVDAKPEHSTSSDILHGARHYTSPTYYLPPLSLEYGHYIRDWFMIGAKATYSSIYSYEHDIYTHKKISKDGSHAISLLVNARFEYLRNRNVRLYSGIGIGAVARFTDYYRLGIPTIDITYIGITLGRDLYGFAEVGGGISGCFRIGMGYKF